ncbi:MAG: polysaccharide export protein [Anaeromyxobacteraceae bacterium]|nr:polysaccharide export protein [Anaeromyxobacteraceae bacterium]
MTDLEGITAPAGRAGWRRPSGLAALLALAACATPGEFVRVEALPGGVATADDEYRIGPGDVLSVRVWNQEAMSLPRAKVRDDGKISVPFLQDVEAASRTPAELATVLKARLQAYVVSPVITVTLEELRPLRVPVMGEVVRPGVYELDRKAGVLVALASAGGFSEFAHRDRIHVLRYQVPLGAPAPLRIRFDYEALARGERAPAAFRLRDGDVVVVD